MLAANMQSGVVQAMRACTRALPAKSLSSSSSSSSRAILARRTLLVAPGCKARLASRGYATAAATKKTTPAKKPAAKKTTSATRKSTASATKKKAAAAKKPAAKKSKAKAKKAAPKKKAAKKPVDPEKKKLLLRRQLKKVALVNQEPKKEAASNWLVYLFDNIKGDKGLNRANFSEKLKEAAAGFKNISPAELQRLEQRVEQNKITNAANYKKWVESYTVAEIYAANVARRRLIRDFGLKINPVKIVDERKPKKPAPPFGLFVKARTSGQTGTPLGAMKQLVSQWNSLSPADKKPYEDLWAAESAKYKREQEKVGL